MTAVTFVASSCDRWMTLAPARATFDIERRLKCCPHFKSVVCQPASDFARCRDPQRAFL